MPDAQDSFREFATEIIKDKNIDLSQIKEENNTSNNQKLFLSILTITILSVMKMRMSVKIDILHTSILKIRIFWNHLALRMLQAVISYFQKSIIFSQ